MCSLWPGGCCFWGDLYAIGGMAESGVSGVVERYTLKSNSWEKVANKPIPAYDISAVVIGGKIFIPGGGWA